MKKIFSILTLLLINLVSLSALEVAKSELESATNTETIVFINYTGPHSKIDSLNSIKGIGTNLAAGISTAPDKYLKNGGGKYTLIHAVNPEIKEGLDADIILIGQNSEVDHIDNLRHIIASYLREAYGYSEKDSETIAVFITVYNAVYRGKIDAFNSKYKSIVTENLSSEKCGLSVNYKEWAGMSQIVIPLFDVNQGGLSTIDTSVISDSQVVKHMQDDDDKNVESRKDMVDLKEREAEEATEKAQESQKTAVQEQKKLNEEKAKTAEAKKEAEESKVKAEEAEQKAKEAEQIAKENPEDQEAQQAAEEARENADEAKSQSESAEEALAEQEAAEEAQAEVAEEAKEEASAQQALADKKTIEAQEERKTIANDQQEIIKEEIKNASAPSAFAIQLIDEANLLSALVKVNTSDGSIIKASPVRFIRNRTVYPSGSNFIAIAGENSGNGIVKLVLLSSDTMEITKESEDTIAENSVLIQDGSEYYCILQENSAFYLGKYDSELNRKLKSEIEVKAATPITVSGNNVMVSDSNGNIVVLDKASLKKI